MNYYNSNDVANILGVNVSTIKRWTDEGKIECIKTVGGHRKFLIQHLENFLKQHKKSAARANFLPIDKIDDLDISYYIVKRDYQALQEYIWQHAMTGRRESVQLVLNSLYLSQTPLFEIYDSLVTGVLYKCGDQWEQKEITIAHEHMVSQIMRDCIVRLQGIIELPEKPVSNALCLVMSSEMHDIALKMVDHILEIRGFNVYDTGQITPSLKIEKLFEELKPQRVYISSTIVNDENLLQAEFDKICYISERLEAGVYIGGRGFDIIDYGHVAVKKRMFTFKEVYET